MKSAPENFIKALRNMPLHMKIKLECLQEIGAIISTRDDVVWYMLLQSMSGMLNNRGYRSIMLNEENYRKLRWKTLNTMAETKRLDYINSVLSNAKVRISEIKAKWLVINIDKINNIGGIEAVLEQKRVLKGKSEKLDFFRQFSGIGEKYARNIWMDLYDSDFLDSIAIDSRLKKIYELLGVSTEDYLNAERYMLDIANKARLTGWELDRLLFHYNDYFISAFSNTMTLPTVDMNELKINQTIVPNKKSYITHKSNSESRRGFIIKRLIKLSNESDVFEINVNEFAEQIAGKIEKYKNTIPQNYIAICNIIRNDLKKEKRKEFNHLLNFSVLQERRNKELIYIFKRISPVN